MLLVFEVLHADAVDCLKDSESLYYVSVAEVGVRRGLNEVGCATSLLQLVSPFQLLRYFPSYYIRAHLEELIYPQLAVDQRSSELEQADVESILA